MMNPLRFDEYPKISSLLEIFKRQVKFEK